MLESVSVGETKEGDDGRHGGASPDDDDAPAPARKCGRRLGWMRYGEGKSGGKVGFCWPAADAMEHEEMLMAEETAKGSDAGKAVKGRSSCLPGVHWGVPLINGDPPSPPP